MAIKRVIKKKKLPPQRIRSHAPRNARFPIAQSAERTIVSSHAQLDNPIPVEIPRPLAQCAILPFLFPTFPLFFLFQFLLSLSLLSSSTRSIRSRVFSADHRSSHSITANNSRRSSPRCSRFLISRQSPSFPGKSMLPAKEHRPRDKIHGNHVDRRGGEKKKKIEEEKGEKSTGDGSIRK